MPRWTCTECGASGVSPTLRDAKNDLGRHIADEHNEPPF